MKNRILIILLNIILVSCNSTQTKQQDKEKKGISDSITNQQTQSVEETRPAENNRQDDCARGQATPIVKKEIYPNTTFVLQPDSISAVETITFENNDNLIIYNRGCEYYVLTFLFQTSRFQEDIDNLQFWYSKAILLLSDTKKGLDTPFDLDKGIENIGKYVDNASKDNDKILKPGVQIDFGEDEIRSFVTIDKVEKITDKKYAIELSFSIGPL